MVSSLDSGASGPCSSPGRGRCVVFLGPYLYHNHFTSWLIRETLLCLHVLTFYRFDISFVHLPSFGPAWQDWRFVLSQLCSPCDVIGLPDLLSVDESTPCFRNSIPQVFHTSSV